MREEEGKGIDSPDSDRCPPTEHESLRSPSGLFACMLLLSN
jgi:hypothetical protein